MSRNPLFHLIALAVALWLAFFVHACSAGRPMRERSGAGDVDAAPLVQVGLGRCLRDPQVRIAVHGPYEVRGRKDQVPAGERVGTGPADPLEL